MLYALADRVVSAEMVLPELRRVFGVSADWTIRWRPPGDAPHAPRACRPYHHWQAADGSRWASFSRDAGRVVVHFARTARFAIDPGARAITCEPVGRAGIEAIRPVLVNQVMPLVLGRERLVLHASAVALPAGAVAFAGPPGAGKSTLAAAMALRGLTLISDDFLVIDRSAGTPHAVPAGVEPRLWPDSAQALFPGAARGFPLVGQRSSKRRVSPAARAGVAVETRAVALAAMFIITPALPPGMLARMARRDAFAALASLAFVAEVDAPSAAHDTLARIAAVVARVPVWQIGMLKDFASLDRVCEAVWDAVSAPALP